MSVCEELKACMFEVGEWSKIKVIGRGQIILSVIVNFKLLV